MRYNPFKPGSIIHPGMFAGRIDELKVLERALFQTQNGNAENFLIHGERGIGKSSLLMVVKYYASGQIKTLGGNIYNFLTVSVELEPNDSYNDLVHKVARELQRELNKSEAIQKLLKDTWKFLTNWEVLGVKYNRENVPQDAMLEELSDKFISIALKLKEKGQGIFLFIDEADKAPVTSGLGEFVKLFSERLTKQGANNVGIGIVGISNVINKMRASHESSVRSLTPIELAPLKPDERKQVVERGLKEAAEKNKDRVEIVENALGLISRLSEGYPHFIQQYAYCAFEEDTDNLITLKDVIGGLGGEHGALTQLGIKFFENMYTVEICSDDYRTVLQVIAEHSPKSVQRKTILGESGLKKYTVDNALTALKKRGSVIAVSGQKGLYRLPSHSFATWIKAFKKSKDV